MTASRAVRSVRAATTSRTSLVVFGLLLAMWVGFRASIAPGGLFFALFPAFGLAFFLDTVAYNQLGLRLPWLMSVLTGVCLYVEAVCLGAFVRWVRLHRHQPRPEYN
jgi:hypothetical protein